MQYEEIQHIPKATTTIFKLKRNNNYSSLISASNRHCNISLKVQTYILTVAKYCNLTSLFPKTIMYSYKLIVAAASHGYNTSKCSKALWDLLEVAK